MAHNHAGKSTIYSNTRLSRYAVFEQGCLLKNSLIMTHGTHLIQYKKFYDSKIQLNFGIIDFINVQHPCSALINFHINLYRPWANYLSKQLCFSSHGIYNALSQQNKNYGDGLWITFLREPFSRCYSSYCQAINRGLIPGNVSFSDWVNAYPHNAYTRRFGPDYETAFKRLNDNFAVVGILERFDTSIDAIEYILKIKIVNRYHFNGHYLTKSSHKTYQEPIPKIIY